MGLMKGLCLSIIVPSYNDGKGVMRLIDQLEMKEMGNFEVVVVESGNTDYFEEMQGVNLGFRLHLLQCGVLGRAAQMNYGAARASGRTLLFLHADSDVREMNISEITDCSRKNSWGNYHITFDHTHWYLRVVEFTSNIRARYFGVVFGDQSLFVLRDVFEKVGGFDESVVFEDVDISGRLHRAFGRNEVLESAVVSSSRRFLKHGVIWTHYVMIAVMFCYGLGFEKLSLRLQRFIR